jgi:5'-nucleotidase
MKHGMNMIRNLMVCCALFLSSMAAEAQTKIEILHTNDTHSCILPLSKNLADTLVAGRGGFVRRLEFVNRERKDNPQLLLFDSGDFSQGSPYYTLFHGDVEVELMNLMGYDAVTIGNHEFDFGMDNMARLFRKANFPVVCCNYDFTGTPLEGLVKPYVVIERNGLKIGVLGVGPELEGLVDEKNCRGVKYEDPEDAAERTVKTLIDKEKCDVVVCLSHLGWEDSDDEGDKEFMSKTKGIDLVLGGHSHSYFDSLKYVKNADGKQVPNDQNGKHGAFVGKIMLNFSK